MVKKRVEKDTLGNVSVENDKFWGAQTQRSLQNFKIGNDIMPIEIIHAMAIIKLSCAKANLKQKSISSKIANAIVQSANTVLSGKYDNQFPLSVWQTGSGTQTNMNVNEVIANLANKKLGKALGSNNPVHPNDHVNMSQSTNDSFPTAINIATAIQTNINLVPALKKIEVTLNSQAKKWNKIIKIGRTHLQDATPLSLGQEFSGYAAQIKSNLKRINTSASGLLALAQGGTAVGTGLNTKKNFDKLVATEISKHTKIKFKAAENKFQALASHDSILELSGALNVLATDLFKIANDIRLLASGPRSGLGELSLPENEPGSSIMPGKVNPTQSEALTMACLQVMGMHNSITMACSQGHFELNAFKPLIALNIIKSIQLLYTGMNNFNDKCLKGIKPNLKNIKTGLENSLMLVTALAPVIGYNKAAEMAKLAHKKGISLTEANIILKYVDPKKMKQILDPRKMISAS
ncbi:class II fumarate hydratase [Pelagibacteraceae bacterium]|jgi:fumarate hydratase class II|nr:class II fumarate hydratase [Pelagibacteraceae bacterium]